MTLSRNQQLFSLDVTSLFTNIPKDLVMIVIKERWNNISRHTDIPLGTFLDGIELILDNCYFSYEKKIYHQKFGSPMGSPISPALAELVLEYLESHVLETIHSSGILLPFYHRYVDDIITAASGRQIKRIQEHFNSFHPRLKFTLELEQDGKLPFLDVLIIKDGNGHLSTDWYHKKTWSGRYLNFRSFLPLNYKLNTISVLTQKVIELSSPQFHQKNFDLIKETLLRNGYPIDLTKNVMNNVIQKYAATRPVERNVPNELKFISVPYTGVGFNKLKVVLLKHDIKLVGKPMNTIGHMFHTRLKDDIPKELRSDVCYEISCDCNVKYIGQTKQHLHKRFKQHQNGDINHSALSEHLVSSGHNINFDNVKILCNESHRQKRDVKEMIYIRMNETINTQTDSLKLGRSYDNLLLKEIQPNK